MNNFSRDTFNKLKHYVGVRLQQGVPIVDADWNEMEDIRKYELESFLKWFVGNGVPKGNDGFRIDRTEDKNDFIISGGDGTTDGAGRCLVEGWEVINEHDMDYTAQPLRENGKADQWSVPPLEDLVAPIEQDRIDFVYLDVWERMVDSQDEFDDQPPPSMVDPHIGIETCVRRKREWVVRVVQDMPVPKTQDMSDQEILLDYLERNGLLQDGHVYYALARLNWRWHGKAPQQECTVSDSRRKGLAVLSEEITIEDGKVGIGTTEPQAMLDVEGTALLGYEITVADFGGMLKSGFYQNGGEDVLGDVPDDAHGWTHLISARHHRRSGNYQLQIASCYAENDRLFFRKIARNAPESRNPPWHEVATRDAGNVFRGNHLFLDDNFDVAEPDPTVRLRVLATAEANGDFTAIHSAVGPPDDTVANERRGIVGVAFGPGGKNIGLEGYAYDAEFNYAGVFHGDVLIDTRLTVATNPEGLAPAWQDHSLLVRGITLLDEVGIGKARPTCPLDVKSSEPYAVRLETDGDQVDPDNYNQKVAIYGNAAGVSADTDIINIGVLGHGEAGSQSACGVVGEVVGADPNDNWCVGVCGWASGWVDDKANVLATLDWLAPFDLAGLFLGDVVVVGELAGNRRLTIGGELPTPAERLHDLVVHGASHSLRWSSPDADYAVYFESRHPVSIPDGTSVSVSEDGMIEPANGARPPIGIIVPSAGNVGNSHTEWPKKFLRDEFGAVIVEEFQEEVKKPKTE